MRLMKKNITDIDSIISIAKDAGKAILSVYNNKNFKVQIKSDNSPITEADLISNEILTNGLKKVSSIPIVSEESYVEYAKRKSWNLFWLIDPLDGTKDFIAGNDEFAINIALIKNNKPILGVVYIPVTTDVYFAQEGLGAFKNHKKIINTSARKELIASDSNFHSTSLVKSFFKKHNITKINRFGASIKLCKLAEGIIDVYPRLNGTKEWDTASGHIIANEAGCKLIDIKTRSELKYNKPSIKNNHFIASRNDLNF